MRQKRRSRPKKPRPTTENQRPALSPLAAIGSTLSVAYGVCVIGMGQSQTEFLIQGIFVVAAVFVHIAFERF